jgi:hypothetical protein
LGAAFQLNLKGFTHASNDPSNTGYYRPWHVFASLKFSTTSSQDIIGYTFGLTYRIMPKLDLLAGYTLSPFNQPAPGFKNAAVLAVTQNPALYPTFNLTALSNNAEGAFDGFPLQKQGSSSGSAANLYSGNPLETQYRGGFMIGISFPVSLLPLFQSSKNSASAAPTSD